MVNPALSSPQFLRLWKTIEWKTIEPAERLYILESGIEGDDLFLPREPEFCVLCTRTSTSFVHTLSSLKLLSIYPLSSQCQVEGELFNCTIIGALHLRLDDTAARPPPPPPPSFLFRCTYCFCFKFHLINSWYHWK